MKILNTIVRCNGTIDTQEIEVAENYFQIPPPQPTTEEKLSETVRAQNATITLMASVIADLQSDVEALQV